MEVEVLYIPECPNHTVTIERVKQVLHEFGLPETVREVEIKDGQSAGEVNP